jgi:hypothetical protein
MGHKKSKKGDFGSIFVHFFVKNAVTCEDVWSTLWGLGGWQYEVMLTVIDSVEWK